MSKLYRYELNHDTTDTEDWWAVVNTESEADEVPAVVALAETETMALHIQLIPDMKAALTEALTELDESNAETREGSRYRHLWAVLDTLKVLE